MADKYVSYKAGSNRCVPVPAEKRFSINWGRILLIWVTMTLPFWYYVSGPVLFLFPGLYKFNIDETDKWRFLRDDSPLMAGPISGFSASVPASILTLRLSISYLE